MNNNGNGHTAPEEQIPAGLVKLSEAAIKKQIAINEAIEFLRMREAFFLRAFNGSVMDPDMIKKRIYDIKDAWTEVETLLNTITTPYLD